MSLPTVERQAVREVDHFNFFKTYPAGSGSFVAGWPLGMSSAGYAKNLVAGEVMTPLGICQETKTVTADGTDTVEVESGTFLFDNGTASSTCTSADDGHMIFTNLGVDNKTVSRINVDSTGFLGRQSCVTTLVLSGTTTTQVAVLVNPELNPISGSV